MDGALEKVTTRLNIAMFDMLSFWGVTDYRPFVRRVRLAVRLELRIYKVGRKTSYKWGYGAPISRVITPFTHL